MKKRILTMLLAVCFIVPCMFLLAACGNVDVVGKTFKVDSIEVVDYPDGTPSEEIENQKTMASAIFANVTIKFEEKTFVMTMINDEESEPITMYWQYAEGDKSKVEIYDSEDMTGDSSMVMSINGNKVSYEDTNEGFTCKFVFKQA